MMIKISKKISVVIWSHDRAMQLHSLISSLAKFTNPLFQLNVIWSFSNHEFGEGYELCFNHLDEQDIPIVSEYKGDEFEKYSKLFLSDKNNQSEFVSLMCDDNILFRPCMINDDNINEIFEAWDDNILCFSPRLGLNTILQNCYNGQYQPPLKNYIELNNDMIAWDYQKIPPTLNYGYVYSTDGHIYRRNELWEIVKNLSFSNTSALEGGLYTYASKQTKSLLASHKHSVQVNLPINQILQQSAATYGHFHPYSKEELNKLFLQGKTIDLHNMNFDNIIACHQELELKFK